MVSANSTLDTQLKAGNTAEILVNYINDSNSVATFLVNITGRGQYSTIVPARDAKKNKPTVRKTEYTTTVKAGFKGKSIKITHKETGKVLNEQVF